MAVVHDLLGTDGAVLASEDARDRDLRQAAAGVRAAGPADDGDGGEHPRRELGPDGDDGVVGGDARVAELAGDHRADVDQHRVLRARRHGQEGDVVAHVVDAVAGRADEVLTALLEDEVHGAAVRSDLE